MLCDAMQAIPDVDHHHSDNQHHPKTAETGHMGRRCASDYFVFICVFFCRSCGKAIQQASIDDLATLREMDAYSGRRALKRRETGFSTSRSQKEIYGRNDACFCLGISGLVFGTRRTRLEFYDIWNADSIRLMLLQRLEARRALRSGEPRQRTWRGDEDTARRWTWYWRPTGSFIGERRHFYL